MSMLSPSKNTPTRLSAGSWRLCDGISVFSSLKKWRDVMPGLWKKKKKEFLASLEKETGLLKSFMVLNPWFLSEFLIKSSWTRPWVSENEGNPEIPFGISFRNPRSCFNNPGTRSEIRFKEPKILSEPKNPPGNPIWEFCEENKHLQKQRNRFRNPETFSGSEKLHIIV